MINHECSETLSLWCEILSFVDEQRCARQRSVKQSGNKMLRQRRQQQYSVSNENTSIATAAAAAANTSHLMSQLCRQLHADAAGFAGKTQMSKKKRFGREG
jgi:hypothetical protein